MKPREGYSPELLTTRQVTSEGWREKGSESKEKPASYLCSHPPLSLTQKLGFNNQVNTYNKTNNQRKIIF